MQLNEKFHHSSTQISLFTLCPNYQYTLCFNKKQPLGFLVITSAKLRPIFKILKLSYSQGDYLCSCGRNFHPTLTMLLHYLVKFENSKWPCFKNNLVIFSSFLPQMFIICNKYFKKCALVNKFLK